MRRKDTDQSDLEEQLADAQAQLESLQATVADAEARAATARAELNATGESQSTTAQQLAEATAVRDSALAELAQSRTELADARAQLSEAAAKYREARLASAPEIPNDLVPELASIAEVDREFEAAQRVVSQLREKMQAEEAARPARVPIGSPPRRPPDLSGLSPSEKIKLGLQQREGS